MPIRLSSPVKNCFEKEIPFYFFSLQLKKKCGVRLLLSQAHPSLVVEWGRKRGVGGRDLFSLSPANSLLAEEVIEPGFNF